MAMYQPGDSYWTITRRGITQPEGSYWATTQRGIPPHTVLCDPAAPDQAVIIDASNRIRSENYQHYVLNL